MAFQTERSERVFLMRVYLAGNLPQLNTKGREKAVLEKMIKIGPYRRLISFYFLNQWKDVLSEIYQGGFFNGKQKDTGCTGGPRL